MNIDFKPHENDIEFKSQEDKMSRASEMFKPMMSTPTSAMMQAGNAVNQNPTARGLAEAEASMLMPPLRFGAPALTMVGRGGQAIGEMMGRILQGTGLNTFFDAGQSKTPEEYKNNFKHNLGWNAALEAGTMPIRGLSQLHEIYNPIRYARDKAGQIKNEMTASKAVMENMFKPVNEKYNNSFLTLKPKEYLESAGITREKLHPRAQEVYDEFLKEPKFKSMHDLQSQLGIDWAEVVGKDAEKAQLFQLMREKSQNKIQNFLSTDENALKQYNDAREFSRNVHYPYQTTPTLRKIAEGKLDLDPKKMADSLRLGSEKMIGKTNRQVIPLDHPLRNHLADLNRRIGIGKLAEFMVPAAGGAIGASLIHPGLSSLLGPAGAAGSLQLKASLKKAGMSNFAQNPQAEALFKNVFAPMYYGAGRGAIGATNE